MRSIGRLGTFLLLLLVAAIATIYWCNRKIEYTADKKLYTNTDSIPYNKTGLLLGTSKYLANGRENPFFYYRIRAAANLIKAGKIKYIIVSGDNSRKEYDEPTQMRADLIAAGIDSTIIYLDYAGFRTFDSMVRLKEIFGQRSVTVISQKFHNERAIYIASREGIDAIGFDAADVKGGLLLRMGLREKLARVKVFVDYLFDTKPKFLGEKVIIPG